MVRRRIPPGVVEALERVVAALWFAAVLVLLYLTLQAQLTRAEARLPAEDPGPDWSRARSGA